MAGVVTPAPCHAGLRQRVRPPQRAGRLQAAHSRPQEKVREVWLPRADPLRLLQGPARPGRAARLQVHAAIRVRPYTVRRGDTLSTIAKKRGGPRPPLAAAGSLPGAGKSRVAHLVVWPCAAGAALWQALDRLRQLACTQPRPRTQACPTACLARSHPRGTRLWAGVRQGSRLPAVEAACGAELNFEELVKLNHDVKPDMLEEGQTIILPAGKLSIRDREILAGALGSLVTAQRSLALRHSRRAAQRPTAPRQAGKS